MVWTFTVLLIAVPQMIHAASSCSLPTTAKTGSLTSVKLRIYDCHQASSSVKPTCVKKKDVSLRKGFNTNLYYDKNGYSVMARFYGKEVCVSYRKKEKKSDNSIHYNCEKECFDDKEEESYYSQPGGKKDLLKFELSSAAADMKTKQIATMAVFSMFGLLYLLSA